MSDREQRIWPEDETPPTEEELALAQRLGEQVDHLLAGERPAAGDELVAAAAMVHGAQVAAPLEERRREQLVEQAMRQALARPAPGRARRFAPLVALAASVLLLLSTLLLLSSPPTQIPAQRRPAQLLSRPSNSLIGRPIEDRGGASQRLDLVFADRLSGYRMVTLGQATEEP
jgi:hypothetical protein